MAVSKPGPREGFIDAAAELLKINMACPHAGKMIRPRAEGGWRSARELRLVNAANERRVGGVFDQTDIPFSAHHPLGPCGGIRPPDRGKKNRISK